jgi:hypothetical protein
MVGKEGTLGALIADFKQNLVSNLRLISVRWQPPPYFAMWLVRTVSALRSYTRGCKPSCQPQLAKLQISGTV